ncbi:MAG: hypothetical protein JO007_04275, partial [Alphaproteobacteria bacterium]|nr:hypothetical protein [Alphaproteobacteria bacterium]
MPFDNARTFNLKAIANPDITGLEIAVARFNSPHPYLLFHSTGLPEIRRQAAANPRLQARTAKLLAEIPAMEVRGDPRALIKRRARRLINTAFLAVTAEPPVAKVALAASRDAVAQFA